ncbi:MAG: hypothetical protein AAF740_09905 [Bacteroidota bacterium]
MPIDSIDDYFSHWGANSPKPFKAETEFTQESIPARITMGRFIALERHLSFDQKRFALDQHSYFAQKLQKRRIQSLKRIRNLLYNSWNTEYLLRMSDRQSEDYLRIALHWSFPQAYYCIYLNMNAFFTAKSIHCKTHDALIRQFASLVEHKAYPEAISFFLTGELQVPDFQSLPQYNPNLKNVELSPIQNIEEADTSIGNFLLTTRRHKAKQIKEDRQARKRTAIKTKEGNIRKQFAREHWKVITDKMGSTTLLDLLYRLRIKANYQEVDSFIQGEINCRPFYAALRELVAYLNFVHESYTARIIGLDEFTKIVEEFPGRKEQRFVEHRLNKRIRPLF